MQQEIILACVYALVIDRMFQRDLLPEFSSDVVARLANLDMNYLSHLCMYKSSEYYYRLNLIPNIKINRISNSAQKGYEYWREFEFGMMGAKLYIY